MLALELASLGSISDPSNVHKANKPSCCKKNLKQKKILSEPENINWMYHTKFEYGRQELEESGVKLFDVEEYEWKYMIKTTKKK